MKGTILYCLEEAIIDKYDQKTWSNCMVECGFSPHKSFVKQIRDDIDEKESVQLFQCSAKVLGLELKSLFDMFGEYWCCEYAPSIYAAFFVGIMNTKKAITKLDWVHDRVTRNIPNSKPPRFIYEWHSENLLELKYQSSRGLIDLLISLIKGLNKKFNDSCIITKCSENTLMIKFLEEAGKTEVIHES